MMSRRAFTRESKTNERPDRASGPNSAHKIPWQIVAQMLVFRKAWRIAGGSSLSLGLRIGPSSAICHTQRAPELSAPKGNILADQMIYPPGSGKSTKGLRLLRRAVVWDEVGKREIVDAEPLCAS
jgi:hypothetical protein